MGDTACQRTDALKTLATMGILFLLFSNRQIDINTEITFNRTGTTPESGATMIDNHALSRASIHRDLTRPEVMLVCRSQDFR